MAKVKKQESEKVLRTADKLSRLLDSLDRKYHDEEDTSSYYTHLYSKTYDALYRVKVSLYGWID